MKMVLRRIFGLALLTLVFARAYAKDESLDSASEPKFAKIAVISDGHGNRARWEASLRWCAANGVTHIVSMGDVAGLSELESFLAQMAPLSGVPKGRTFLVPGNHEIDPGNETRKLSESKRLVTEVHEKFGHAVTDDFRSLGIFEINGIRYSASHAPIRPVPEEILPDLHYSGVAMRYHAARHTARHIYPPNEVVHELVAHTHKGGIVRTNLNTILINSGTISDLRDAKDRPGFAVLDEAARTMSRIDVETFKPLQSVAWNLPVRMTDGSYNGRVLTDCEAVFGSAASGRVLDPVRMYDAIESSGGQFHN